MRTSNRAAATTAAACDHAVFVSWSSLRQRESPAFDRRLRTWRATNQNVFAVHRSRLKKGAMSEYALSRTRSAAIVRSNSVASRPTVLVRRRPALRALFASLATRLQLQRTYSVPDLTSYVSTSPRYRPQWPSYYSSSYSWPYRYYRDYSLVSAQRHGMASFVLRVLFKSKTPIVCLI